MYTWIEVSAQEGPVPAKSFYGAVDPITSLKVLKAVPTLKSAFSACTGEVKESEKEPAPKKHKGKTCTGYFGCKNIASFQENSGTVYCREHRPKNIHTTAILVEKGKKKKTYALLIKFKSIKNCFAKEKICSTKIIVITQLFFFSSVNVHISFAFKHIHQSELKEI